MLQRLPRFSSLSPLRRGLVLGALLLCFILVAVAAFRGAEGAAMSRLRQAASHQLDILAAAIDSEVTRHASMPIAVELNPDILALLRAQSDLQDVHQADANYFLQQLNDNLGGPVIFVLDTRGKVIASSDWIFSDNLLGRDLSYLPLFQSALSGVAARHYAIDSIRQEPGFYFAQPVRDPAQEWRIIGVVVVKSGLRELERNWLAQEAPAVVVDTNGIVLFASPAEWRYASLQPLPPETLSRISQAQFASQSVGSLSLDIGWSGLELGQVVRLPKHLREDVEGDGLPQPYLALSRNLPGTAWRLIVFSDLRRVSAEAVTHAALAVAALGCLLFGMLFLGQRSRRANEREAARHQLMKANQELERKVDERTADLQLTVGALQREVTERQRAEQTLRAAQGELVQAAKLAVLGQMATGITHEMSQPLGAIQTLSANAAEFMKRGDLETAEKNLVIVGQLAGQMGGLITPLKTFARKSPAVAEAVDVGQAVEAALFLFEQRLRKLAVTVDKPCVPGQWVAWCDQNRLQQVLVNLIANALDAMSDAASRTLVFAVQPENGTTLALTVEDSGSGFSDEALSHLFEPFFTTKRPGEGLGLGLTISRDILRDFGGDLSADRASTGGARFTIRLPVPPQGDKA